MVSSLFLTWLTSVFQLQRPLFPSLFVTTCISLINVHENNYRSTAGHRSGKRPDSAGKGMEEFGNITGRTQQSQSLVPFLRSSQWGQPCLWVPGKGLLHGLGLGGPKAAETLGPASHPCTLSRRPEERKALRTPGLFPWFPKGSFRWLSVPWVVVLLQEQFSHP